MSEKETFGWIKEQAEKDGFDNIREWQIHKRFNVKNIALLKKSLYENKMVIKDIWIFYRFWNKVDIKDNTEECWNWLGYIEDNGYGRFSLAHDKPEIAHRMAYILVKGSISEDEIVMHRCNNRSCCNPSHLESGDQLKNMRYCSATGRASVKLIHELRHSDISVKDIAAKFNVSRSMIYLILSGKCWKNIYDEFQTKNK